MEADSLYHAIYINTDRCIGCSHCIKVCPTDALHIWNGHSNLNADRCIDCDECYRVCPVSAIQVKDDGLTQIENFDTRVALVPSVFMGQFPNHIKANQVFDAIQELGFNYVYEVEEGSQTAEKFIFEEIEKKENLPLISSFCPAIVRLIQVNFPQFSENIINLKPPADITATYVRKKLKEHKNLGIFYVTQCSAKITSLKAPLGEEKSVLDGVINMDSFFNKIQKVLNKNENINVQHKGYKDHKDRWISNNAIKPDHILWSLTGGEAKNLPGTCLSIDGIKNIISFLDRIETQGCKEIDFLEIKGCDQGCAGGILTPQNRFLTAQKLRTRSKYYTEYYRENAELEPKHHDDWISLDEVKIKKIEPRSIVKYDSNPMIALQKMQLSQKFNRILPSLDCGACGYATCNSLARNVVEKKADLNYCFVIQRKEEEDGALKVSESKKILEDIWGEKKFKYKSKL